MVAMVTRKSNFDIFLLLEIFNGILKRLWGLKFLWVGQSESDEIFISGVKAKELMITGSSILLFLFQWKNKNMDLFPMGSVIFGIQKKIPSDLLFPTIFILPHPTPCKDL